LALLNKSNFAELKIRSRILPTTQTIPWQSKSSESPTGPPTTKLINRGSLTFWLDDERLFRPGMSRNAFIHEEGLSAILISPSPPSGD
jgi:hypothetical protein